MQFVIRNTCASGRCLIDYKFRREIYHAIIRLPTQCCEAEVAYIKDNCDIGELLPDMGRCKNNEFKSDP